ncbi:hypothetical protein XELAEV_18007640mg [Xenopus laevis]|uniref:Ig-like domain-containing protein n=1 Tax=Xenopus laevis TaxID=8355 RepID=A0A974E127_XENLA|nr:hypothetical protein XELAEV_18007640mg [Xenopus laevis]
MSQGKQARMSCELTEGTSISSYSIRFYQQTLGNVPHFVYRYFTNSDQQRGAGIPERFSVTPDISRNLWELVISHIQPEDDARYYCDLWNSGTFSTELRYNKEVIHKPKSVLRHLLPLCH